MTERRDFVKKLVVVPSGVMLAGCYSDSNDPTAPSLAKGGGQSGCQCSTESEALQSQINTVTSQLTSQQQQITSLTYRVNYLESLHVSGSGSI